MHLSETHTPPKIMHYLKAMHCFETTPSIPRTMHDSRLCATLKYTMPWSLTAFRPHLFQGHLPPDSYRLVGLVVKASASRAEDPGFESRWRRGFSGSSHTSDLNFGTPVATLPGAWRYSVSAGTGRPGVSIL